MKRIDPADAPALFRRTGLRPEQFCFYRKAPGSVPTPCGCLTTALLLDATPPGERAAVSETWWKPALGKFPAASGADVLASWLGFTRPYSHGLISGWDGETDEDLKANVLGDFCATPKGTAEYRAGIDDGREAWDAVAAEGREGGTT